VNLSVAFFISKSPPHVLQTFIIDNYKAYYNANAYRKTIILMRVDTKKSNNLEVSIRYTHYITQTLTEKQ